MLPNDATLVWPHPPRRRVYLMRHGDVVYFDADGRPFRPDTVPLTAVGQSQARAAGAALARIGIDRAITSGLARTAETARLVVGDRPIPILSEPRLREIEPGRMSEWEKAPPELIRRAFLSCLGTDLTPASQFLAGETIASCVERVLAVWSELLARDDWRTLLVVAHGVVNRLLLTHLLGTPLASLGKLEQDAGCLNLIEIDSPNAPLVRLVNFTAHDAGKETLLRTTFEALYDQYLRGRRP